MLIELGNSGLDSIDPAQGTFGAFLYRGVRGLVPHNRSKRFGAFNSSLGVCIGHVSKDLKKDYCSPFLYGRHAQLVSTVSLSLFLIDDVNI